jgi:heptosyltransferase-1
VEPTGDHAVERALSLLAGLDLPREPADFGGEKLFAGASPWPDCGFVLIHPGAGWGNKVYPPGRWGEVARRLRADGLAVKVATAPAEQALAAEVERTSGGAAEPVAAPDLPTLGRLLRSAALVLAGDTGPLHLAHALGTPVLALMGPTDPRTHGPYGDLERGGRRSLAVVLPCSFCHKRFDATRACLLAIEPRAVAERALEVLAGVG